MRGCVGDEDTIRHRRMRTCTKTTLRKHGPHVSGGWLVDSHGCTQSCVHARLALPAAPAAMATSGILASWDAWRIKVGTSNHALTHNMCASLVVQKATSSHKSASPIHS